MSKYITDNDNNYNNNNNDNNIIYLNEKQKYIICVRINKRPKRYIVTSYNANILRGNLYFCKICGNKITNLDNHTHTLYDSLILCFRF